MSKHKIIALTALIILAFSLTAIGNAVAEEKMTGKYLILWELDQTKLPIDPKERAAGWAAFMAMVRKDHERGVTTSWGSILGGGGYTLMEGTVLEVMIALQQYVPFVTYKVHAIASESQVNELIKALSK